MVDIDSDTAHRGVPIDLTGEETTIEHDKLVLSMGAGPVRLPIPGTTGFARCALLRTPRAWQTMSTPFHRQRSDRQRVHWPAPSVCDRCRGGRASPPGPRPDRRHRGQRPHTRQSGDGVRRRDMASAAASHPPRSRPHLNCGIHPRRGLGGRFAGWVGRCSVSETPAWPRGAA